MELYLVAMKIKFCFYIKSIEVQTNICKYPYKERCSMSEKAPTRNMLAEKLWCSK